jgi:hypothetical protein
MEAVEKLISIMRTGEPDQAIKACNALLDRAYGKPTQVVAGEQEGEAVKIEAIVIRGIDP